MKYEIHQKGGDMRAFHGQQAVKDKYLSRVRAHREADNLTQGTGWYGGRGCAVGCTLESYDHTRYPTELGLPEWMAHLEDRTFEGLPKEIAMQWPERFLAAIPVGADVEIVRHQLAVRRLTRLHEAQSKALAEEPDAHGPHEAIMRTLRAIEVVRSCHEAEMGGNVCDWSAAWSAARSAAQSAARSAAWAAASAAQSAAESAESAELAESAAESAELAAASAAQSAAESAESAELARSAARSAAWSAAASAAQSAARSAWQQEADDLIDLLSAVPC